MYRYNCLYGWLSQTITLHLYDIFSIAEIFMDSFIFITSVIDIARKWFAENIQEDDIIEFGVHIKKRSIIRQFKGIKVVIDKNTDYFI